nr:MAG TPA: hypothetical protein [Caudoviricetes sp.]
MRSTFLEPASAWCAALPFPLRNSRLLLGRAVCAIMAVRILTPRPVPTARRPGAVGRGCERRERP